MLGFGDTKERFGSYFLMETKIRYLNKMQEAEMLPRLKTAGQALRGEVREGCTGEAPFAQRREE